VSSVDKRNNIETKCIAVGKFEANHCSYRRFHLNESYMIQVKPLLWINISFLFGTDLITNCAITWSQ